MGELIDVANCVLFLAFDEVRLETGATLVVDGGEYRTVKQQGAK